MNIFTYIKNLVCDAFKWQKVGIGQKQDEIDKIKTHWYSFSKMQIVFIVLSILYITFKNNGFSFDLIGYILAMFSIFVGLLLSLLISMFDKFNDTDFSSKNSGIVVEAYTKKLKNYFIQFNTLTTYSILLALLNIILLSFYYIFDFLNESISIKFLVINVKENICFEWYYIKHVIILIHRMITIYFFLDFFYLLIYSLTSIYSFINKEYKK
jgi:hypothetical protein